MNNNSMRQILSLFLGLVSLSLWAQQSTPSSATDSSPQTATIQDASNMPLKTADGMAVCPADFKTKSLPDGYIE
ncbi:hypothetical protein [Terracidiphilus gabretensis]|jgi:hypothetical protein|uniref:hypothetical protein n=1 Tax=Terracidiphilus gabretensis TaxID=1577687 RepID=UPI00071BC7A1|nr:hypothetical protein [Terracidiphilus gabretensis]